MVHVARSLIKNGLHRLEVRREEKKMGRSTILRIGEVCASEVQNTESGVYWKSPDEGRKAAVLPSECLIRLKSGDTRY